MVLIHAGYFSHELGMCMQSDVLLPQSEGPQHVAVAIARRERR